MSVVIKTDEKKDWQVTGKVDGESHDHCPSCDTVVEPKHGFGGEFGTPLLWQQYSHDMREGGCGAAWTRTTRHGQERNTSRGAQTKWTTGSATRTYHVASPAYEANYDRIFRKDASQ